MMTMVAVLWGNRINTDLPSHRVAIVVVMVGSRCILCKRPPINSPDLMIQPTQATSGRW